MFKEILSKDLKKINPISINYQNIVDQKYFSLDFCHIKLYVISNVGSVDIIPT